MYYEEPSLSEWRDLYQLADEFRQMAPWTWMSDIDLFGVQDPESSEIGYCCVMGQAGQVFGLHVYQGAEGLSGYWAMANADGTDAGYADVATVQKCIAVNFDDRADLRPRDLETIKRLGLKYRGRNAWPHFFSMLPCYASWYLDSQEARFLTLALRQTFELAPRLRENPQLLPDFTDARDEKYLVRVPRETPTGHEFVDSIEPAPTYYPTIPFCVTVDRTHLERLSQTLPRVDSTYEIDYVAAPTMPIAGGPNERPWIPNIMLIAETRRGLILGSDTASGTDTAQCFTDLLIRTIETTKALPKAVHICRPALSEVTQSVCDILKVEFRLKKTLPKVMAARKSMGRFM